MSRKKLKKKILVAAISFFCLGVIFIADSQISQDSSKVERTMSGMTKKSMKKKGGKYSANNTEKVNFYAQNSVR